MYSSSAASSSSRFSPRRPFSAAIVILILTFLCSMFIVGFIYLLIIVKHVETSIYENLESKWHPDQIPMNHKPFLYDLRLKLYFAWNKNLSFDQQENTFDGSVRINFESGGGSRIILHSKNISIEECFLIKPNGEEIIVNNMTYGDDFDIFNIFLDFEMENERNYSLKINYSGKFEEKNKYGLFQIPYANGQKYILATHLQMTEARTVLPCIDIPSAKAQFAVTLIHPIGTHAVGNMMENKISNDSNWTTTSFKTTPFMSTYLLAFVISDYPYLEKVTKNGIRTRVYCDPEKIENAKLAISVVEPLLDFFRKIFQCVLSSR
ncbi:unnamed protein product [Caenorhabditis angaria]|uniref:Aminopeptidase N-like N-terminal domain-containing protein n=1 Tax=Caenorhabditis angaria TaxID=860376 RepID=A0A9P1ISW7_9PELO|nr:unnamed protein product [Caenorhabditis angaria]